MCDFIPLHNVYHFHNNLIRAFSYFFVLNSMLFHPVINVTNLGYVIHRTYYIKMDY